MSVTITVPLDIPEVSVLDTEITSEGVLLLTVASTQEHTQCGLCGETISCTFGHGSAVRLRHLPVLGFKTYVILRPKRGQCLACEGTTTTQQLDGYQQRSPHTCAYDEHLVKQLLHSTVADVSLKEEVGYEAVVGALNRLIEPQIN